MELRIVIVGILFAGALLAAGSALAGDDDKAPAYRIYIDPETGMYTTEDPLAPEELQPVAAARPPTVVSTDGAQDQSSAALLSLAAMLAIVAGGVFIYRRRPTT